MSNVLPRDEILCFLDSQWMRSAYITSREGEPFIMNFENSVNSYTTAGATISEVLVKTEIFMVYELSLARITSGNSRLIG